MKQHFVNVDIVALWPHTDSDAKRSGRKMECQRTLSPSPPRFLLPIQSSAFYSLLWSVHSVLNICAKRHVCCSWINCHISLICVWRCRESKIHVRAGEYSKFIYDMTEVVQTFITFASKLDNCLNISNSEIALTQGNFSCTCCTIFSARCKLTIACQVSDRKHNNVWPAG